MKVVAVYRYGIVGGVSSQLLLRRRALRAVGVDLQLHFSQDNGLGAVLDDREGVQFGPGRALARLLASQRPDAVVVIDTPELLDLARGPIWRRRRVYLDVHTTTDRGLAYLRDLDARGLAGVSAPTRHAAALVRQHLTQDRAVALLPNIVDADRFHPGADPSVMADAAAPASPRQLIWVGKLDHHKNWRLALVYTALCRELLGDARLTLVGGHAAAAGQARALFELAQRLSLSAHLEWLDRVDNRDLPALYRRCARSGGAMLVTSRDESFGMAAAEALLCGCPLITQDLPVFREVFPESPMIRRVDIWSPRSVAAALREPLPPAPDSVAALRTTLVERYGPETFVRAFRALLADHS